MECMSILSSEKIDCPSCGVEVIITVEDYPELFTYHGDSEAVQVECDSCEDRFSVQERLMRSFTVEEIPDDVL